MIKIITKRSKINQIECDCGNTKDFIKYKSFKIVKNERNRNLQIPQTGIACAKKNCKQILTEEELNKQLHDQKVKTPGEVKS